MTRITIIVPNYQGKKVFPACLDSLLDQDCTEPYEIIFVDDSSTDGSLALAKEKFGKAKNVTITQTEENSGYVGACNHGFSLSKGNFITIVNNDMIFPRYWIREMYRGVTSKRKRLCASLLNKNLLKNRYEMFDREKVFPTASPVGVGGVRSISNKEMTEELVEIAAAGILMIPREAIKERIFHYTYFAYGEDIELCYRLRLQGYTVIMNLRTDIEHYDAYTSKTDIEFSRLAVFHGTKNSFENQLVFHNAKNTVALIPPFLVYQAGLFLARPRQMWQRLKAYAWVLTHPHTIWKHRKDVQAKRKISDEEFFSIMTYKLRDPAFVDGVYRPLLRMANWCLKWYYRAWGIRTIDNYKN